MTDLARRYGLRGPAERRLAALVELLAEDPLAPTTIRDRSRIVDDHLADSLVGLQLDAVRDALAIADLGSGAGLPGLPLAIALPAAEVFLVESATRKCAFIERAVAACALDNARVVHGRAEAWSDGLGRFDVVTVRAVASLPVVAEYAAPLLRVGGMMVAWRGQRDPQDELSGAKAAAELGMTVREPLPVTPYAGAHHRHLHLMLKVSATPDRFPRRPGIALKRPLGGE